MQVSRSVTGLLRIRSAFSGLTLNFNFNMAPDTGVRANGYRVFIQAQSYIVSGTHMEAPNRNPACDRGLPAYRCQFYESRVEGVIWEFPKIRGTLFWGLYK